MNNVNALAVPDNSSSALNSSRPECSGCEANGADFAALVETSLATAPGNENTPGDATRIQLPDDPVVDTTNSFGLLTTPATIAVAANDSAPVGFLSPDESTGAEEKAAPVGDTDPEAIYTGALSAILQAPDTTATSLAESPEIPGLSGTGEELTPVNNNNTAPVAPTTPSAAATQPLQSDEQQAQASASELPAAPSGDATRQANNRNLADNNGPFRSEETSGEILPGHNTDPASGVGEPVPHNPGIAKTGTIPAGFDTTGTSQESTPLNNYLKNRAFDIQTDKQEVNNGMFFRQGL